MVFSILLKMVVFTVANITVMVIWASRACPFLANNLFITLMFFFTAFMTLVNKSRRCKVRKVYPFSVFIANVHDFFDI